MRIIAFEISAEYTEIGGHPSTSGRSGEQLRSASGTMATMPPTESVPPASNPPMNEAELEAQNAALLIERYAPGL